MPEEWCMDALFRNLRITSRNSAPFSLLDPGMRRDDGIVKLK
jgi:hypothetical protein